MNWLKYVREYRRFERHSLKEVVLQTLLPNDWEQVVSVEHVDHATFDMACTGLYDPETNQPHQQGPIQGFIINDGVLWPAVGGIRSSDGMLIEESFFDENSRRFAVEKGYLKRFPLIEENGAVATLGHVYRNYYHRWADSIPRIYALHHPDVEALAPVRVYVDGRFTDDEKSVIRHLLPTYAELVVTDSALRVQAAKCIHLPYMSSDRTDHSKWFNASAGFLPQEGLNWLRNEVYALTGLQPAEPFRKLYVTRRNAKVRRLLNEEETATYLERRGFKVVALEKRPFREQVQLFAEAKVIVAQHGAGLTNLLFAQSPCVLEILSDKDRQIFFSLVSVSHGFVHEQLTMDGENKNDNVTLPIDRLEAGLASLESRIA